MAYTTVDNPGLFFNTKLWTGNDGSGHAITGVGFQPDFVWIKNRNTTDDHNLFDSVRGNTKTILSNSNAAEATNTSRLESFDSDGITVGADNDTNRNGDSIVGWNWKANGGTTSSNSNGSITSTVQANTTAGFSIVSYTGTGSNATIGHGLSSAPSMIIFKTRGTGNWLVYHQGIGNTHGVFLNTTSAKDDDATYFQDTDPTSSVFSIGTSTLVNDTNAYIAYCFAEIKGYSKFGSYTGNGGSQFIYTGFKPAFVIEKRSSNASEWDMYDNKRNTFNSVTKVLKPNDNAVEATYSGLNFLSNGFEAKGSLNDSGQTLIYMAFAETPFVTAGTKAPGTAR